jgi:hypothetical protein
MSAVASHVGDDLREAASLHHAATADSGALA